MQKSLTTQSSETFETVTLDVGILRTSCPLILSVFQEVLRVRSYNASVRAVLKDTMLSDRYLLKKDAVIHMPSHVIHNDTTVWGPNASDFQADRFMSKSDATSGKEKRRHPGAFRAFGGGTTLCPGRHFAMTTIISIVAMLVLRYDIVPVGGRWIKHTQKINHLVAAILPPDQDVEVEFRIRSAKKGNWSFVLGQASTSSFASADE